MSENTQAPAWIAEIRTALQAWHEAKPETRHIIAIAIGESEDGDMAANASIIGNPRLIEYAVLGLMADTNDDNDVGRVLRIAAIKHVMRHTKEIGTIEINIGSKDEQDNEAEPEDSESHE